MPPLPRAQVASVKKVGNFGRFAEIVGEALQRLLILAVVLYLIPLVMQLSLSKVGSVTAASLQETHVFLHPLRCISFTGWVADITVRKDIQKDFQSSNSALYSTSAGLASAAKCLIAQPRWVWKASQMTGKV